MSVRQNTGVRCQESGVRIQNSGVRSQESEFNILNSVFCILNSVFCPLSSVVSLLLTAYCLLLTAPIFGEEQGFIRIFEPAFFSTTQPKITVAGRIDEFRPKHLRLSITSFMEERKSSSLIPVTDGRFREDIELFSGLNIITLTTLSGKIKAINPVFLVSKKEKKEDWGKTSSIIFTSPVGPRIKPPFLVEGVVTDPEIKEIEVVVIGLYGQKIRHLVAPVSNMKFSFLLPDLSFGINIVLAKPGKSKVSPSEAQFLPLIFEPESDRLILKEPILEDGSILISGEVLLPSVRNVDISVWCLVSEKDGELAKRITKERIAVKKNGTFQTKIEIKEKLISSPTIVIATPKMMASKTLKAR